MNKMILSSCALIFLAVSALCSCATTQGKTEQDRAAVEQKGYSKQPEHHFMAAHENFLNKEYKEAGDEIRKSAESLRQRSERATEETKEALKSSARELDELADSVEKGTETSISHLEDTFARAHYALAKYYNEKASASYVKKEYKKAGYELKASAMYLKNGMTWAGSKAEEGTESAMDESRRLGDKLIQGSGWTADEFGKGISYLGDEIKKFGKTIEGTKNN